MTSTAPAGYRVAIGLRHAVNVPAGYRVAMAFGDEVVPPDPPDPTVVGQLTAAVALCWLPGSARLSAARHGAWGALAGVVARGGLTWGAMAARYLASGMAWSRSPMAHAAVQAQWRQHAVRAEVGTRSPWSSNPIIRGSAMGRWRTGGLSQQRGVALRWLAPASQRREALALWSAAADPARRAAAGPWNAPPLIRHSLRVPWGIGRGLDWAVRPPVVRPIEPDPLPVDPRRVALRFMCAEYAHSSNRIPLRFGAPACYAARPTERAYIVLNQIEVVRLPDRLPIHVDGVSLAAGREGWCWDAQMSLADPSQLPALSPTVDGPRTVEITLNGYRWVIAVEAHDKGEVWGSTEVSLRGRSVTAQLAEPYAAPRTTEVTSQRTMVQLADAEVAGSTLSVEYGAVDWLVTAGAWYYDGLTPMAALVRLAEASGGTVQSHPSDPVVQIRARYPVSPWDWPTTSPDVVIQDDIVTGARLQLQSKPLYDAVIVAGERVGVAAKVKRAGEAGQTFAPQQVDQLITHADGARERGRNVLADRGGQASIEHDLPLFGAPLQPGQPGLVLPLQLVQRVASEGTWHGLATAVRIEARRQDKAVEIVQTVTIERHYTDAD